MRKKKNNFEIQKATKTQESFHEFQTLDQIYQASPQTKKFKAYSCNQIQQKQLPYRSTRVVNDNLILSLNPKRTSMDLNSFIQVFRKKIRQTTIAKQFQNSLQRFTQLSSNRLAHQNRQKGGFVGCWKKQNELLIENNKVDNKIKKIIISDVEYKDRKIYSKAINPESSQKNWTHKETFNYDNNKSTPEINAKLSRKRIHTYCSQPNQEIFQSTIQLSKKLEGQQNRRHSQNYEVNQGSNFQPIRKKIIADSNKSSSIFSNKRLETITSYQRPNLMYNLNLYRKKHSYNTLNKKKKSNKNPTQPNQSQK